MATSGFVVSDRFHQLAASIAEFNSAAYPPDILALLQKSFEQVEAGGGSDSTPGDVLPEFSALQRDRIYSAAMQELRGVMAPRFVALRYSGLDTVGHYYLRYAQPHTSRGEPEEARRRHAQAIDRHYAFIDAEIGAVLDTIGPLDLLVTISGFGMQPLNAVKQGLGRLFGDPPFTGTHERAPDGFLLAYGAAIEPGRHQRGSIVDVAPTVLYFLGLPVARDMDGYARADLFTRAFTAERPIAFIPSYSR